VAQNGKASSKRSEAPAGSRESDRRRTILRAAIEVFAKKGYHGCRIADVAREAGVAYGLVYHYFKNKEELLQSVFESGWGNFMGRLREVADADTPLETKVRGIAAVAFDSYKVDPRAVKVLILEIGRSPAGGRVNRGGAFAEVMQVSAAMFQSAKAKGELREEVDPVLSAALLFGAIEMGLTAFVVGLFDRKNEEALDRAKEQVAETFLRGVLPGGSEIEWKPERSNTKLKAAKRS
jgi:TetR/AcrR family transcriptional regulator, fatty acid metabolism regulator protein